MTIFSCTERRSGTGLFSKKGKDKFKEKNWYTVVSPDYFGGKRRLPPRRKPRRKWKIKKSNSGIY